MSGSGRDTNGSATRDALHTLCLADPVWAERYDGWIELGRGGSAAVVRTFNRDAGGEVALKVFYGLAAEDRARFEREVRGAQRLASPFIVRTFSPFVRGSLGWIEMELVDGPNLRRELEERSATAREFTLPECCGVAACLAQALVTAHAAGVVHRDVKPANVLLPANGGPAAKLSDFGISRILGATRVTATGLLAGTPQFAAPEVVSGPEIGPAADVYSLALCLYLMLSGNRFPYDLPEGATVAQWLRAHSDAQPRPLRALVASVPSEVADLVGAGLAKDPARRPTATDFVASLAPWADAAVSGTVRRLGRNHWRRSGWRAAFGYATAFVVGLSCGAWLASRGAADSNRASRLPVDRPAAPAPVAAPATPLLDRARPKASPSAAAVALTVASPGSSPAAQAVQLRVAFQSGLLRIANAGRVAAGESRITLRGTDGVPHLAQLSEPLTPGDEVFLAADSFAPPLPSDFSPARAEIAVGEPGAGGRAYTFLLGASGN
jgi:eukaryotic-like serine/threonine-protein kinase